MRKRPIRSFIISLSLLIGQFSHAAETTEMPYDLSTSTQYQVYSSLPQDFKPKFEAVGCFLDVKGKVLLLLRNPDKAEGNCWGIPGGKMEKHESPLEATMREVREETQLNLEESTYETVGTNYLYLPGKNVTFHMFRVCLDDVPEVTINLGEHQTYQWASYSEALELPLMIGEVESFVRYDYFLKNAA